jgi:dipeptidase E
MKLLFKECAYRAYMKIFLSGGGNEKDSLETNKRFSESVNKTRPIIYIPLAMGTQEHPYEQCLEWVSSFLRQLGITKIDMWTELEGKGFTQAREYGGMYISGGNTFKLLKHMKDTNFLDCLDKISKAGMPIYGSSAGALLFAKSIASAFSMDENDAGLRDFSALDMLKGYDLMCHYKPDEDRAIMEFMDRHSAKVIGLPEDGGLELKGDDIEVIGPGSAYVFNGKKRRITPGRNLDI